MCNNDKCRLFSNNSNDLHTSYDIPEKLGERDGFSHNLSFYQPNQSPYATQSISFFGSGGRICWAMYCGMASGSCWCGGLVHSSQEVISSRCGRYEFEVFTTRIATNA